MNSYWSSLGDSGALYAWHGPIGVAPMFDTRASGEPQHEARVGGPATKIGHDFRANQEDRSALARKQDVGFPVPPWRRDWSSAQGRPGEAMLRPRPPGSPCSDIGPRTLVRFRTASGAPGRLGRFHFPPGGGFPSLRDFKQLRGKNHKSRLDRVLSGTDRSRKRAHFDPDSRMKVVQAWYRR